MKVHGLEELINAIERMKKEFPRQTSHFMRRQALKVERLAKEGSPVDTGILKSAWGYENTGKGKGSFEQTVYNKAGYSNHVEFGHRVKGTNKVVKGSYMLKKALNKVEQEFEGELKTLTRRLLR